MARKFFFGATVPSTAAITSRLGAQNAPYKDTEIGKLVKGTAESAHLLCAAGDQIRGQVVGVENATSDGFGIGSVNRKDRIPCIADGLQATLGVGVIALGDHVVCGTVVAKDTGLGATYPKVAKATRQVGTTAITSADNLVASINTALATVVADMALIASGDIWRVISLGAAGTGAVGTEIVIERVSTFG